MITPRRIGYAALIVGLAAAGYYFSLYLTRWEWNRAVVSGIIFLATEIALLGALVLERVSQLRTEMREINDSQQDPTAEILEALEGSAPQARNPFEWLSPKRGTTSVFIPVLLGAGIIVSAVAWLVERIARATAGHHLERSLARDLVSIALPDEPLHEPASHVALFRPGGRP